MMALIVFLFILVGCAEPEETHAATYYVDFVSGDDNNNGTSTSTPWKRVRGMTNAAGSAASAAITDSDTVVFKGGVTWTDSFPWSLRTGTAQSVVYTVDTTWYAGASFTLPVFDRQAGGNLITATSGSGYFTLNQLRFVACGTPLTEASARCLEFTNPHHVTITNNIFECDCSISIYMAFTSANTYSDFIVTGNEATRTSSLWWAGITSNNTIVDQITLSGNVIHDFSAQIGDDGDGTGIHSDGFWHGYLATPSTTTGSYFDNITFCNNRSYGDFRRGFGTNGGVTAMFFQEGGMHTALICNNVFTFWPAQENTFDGLVILQGENNQSPGPVYVINNTFYDPPGANSMSQAFNIESGMENVTLKNNMFVGMNYPVWIEQAGGIASFVADYNMYHTWSNLVWGTVSNFKTWAQWQALGFDVHGTNGGSTGFMDDSVSPFNLDIDLTSSAFRAGQNLSNLGRAELATDYAHMLRGSVWDIGAYTAESFGGMDLGSLDGNIGMELQITQR